MIKADIVMLATGVGLGIIGANMVIEVLSFLIKIVAYL